MRIAHLADLHIGFRQFTRTDRRGVNQREADVERALTRAVDDVIQQRPDLVLLAGDVFHSVRPTNAAIIALFSQLQRIRVALPDTRIIGIAGDHDTPRSTDTAFILPLYQVLGVRFALLTPEQFRLPGNVVVTAVPRFAVTEIPAPDPSAALNILCIHGDVPGFGNPSPAQEVAPDALQSAAWDYIALGHYHVSAQVGPRAWYAGSLEYTSTNPWGDLQKERELGVPGKGYVVVDLPGGVPEFRAVGPTREFLDLEAVDATGMGSTEVDDMIRARVEAQDITGAVVRLKVSGLNREVRAGLNYAEHRAWKAQSLNFHLSLDRAPRTVERASVSRAHTLADRLAEYLQDRDLPSDINRERFVAEGNAIFALSGLDPSLDPYTGVRQEAEERKNVMPIGTTRQARAKARR